MKYAVIFLLFGFFANASQVPEVRELDSDKALMFELSSLEDQVINDYLYGLGYRWYFSDNWSLALGVGFSQNNNQQTIDTLSFDNTGLSWGLNPSLRYNFSSNKNIIGFIGTDLTYFTSTLINEADDIKEETFRNDYSAGLFVGAEWFFTKNISLTAQYRLSYGFRYDSFKVDGVMQNETEESITQLGMGTYKLGLSFFFN